MKFLLKEIAFSLLNAYNCLFFFYVVNDFWQNVISFVYLL